MNWKDIFKQIMVVTGIFLLLVIALFPFYWLAFSSVKVLTDLFEPNVIFPWETTLTLFNYEFAVTKAYPSLISLFFNSLYISILTVVLTLVLIIASVVQGLIFEKIKL